jgi:hypothetical protein
MTIMIKKMIKIKALVLTSLLALSSISASADPINPPEHTHGGGGGGK